MSINAYGQISDNNCDPSATIEATLTVDGAAHDGSFESAGGLNYFQIDTASEVNVNIETTFTNDNFVYSLQLCDGNDDLIASSTKIADSINNIPARLRPGTYYIVVGSSGAVSYQLSVATDTDYNDLLSDCGKVTTNFNDPLYGCQWHLKNTGQLEVKGQRITEGEDINIEGVWNDGISGRGINVAVVDSGMDPLHEDLVANVNPSLNHDYSGNSNVFNPSSDHGTLVAGVIAAVGDNGIGIRGVAPQASIYNYNLIKQNNYSSANRADAMTRNRAITAVSSNSWGARDLRLHSAERTWEMAVETGIREGFGGKGIFYSWSAGNGHDDFVQANFGELSNYYAVTTVCSTDGFGKKSSFSEEGVNLWVCAPGSLITTTDNKDRYNFRFSGTSFSAPIVSGVAALMREVNGDLSWRDLKLILAASARRNDPTDPGWETVALKYGSDTDSYNYNPKYGFGVVDAEAAVELAGSWNRVAQMRTLTASSGHINTAIPDAVGEVDGTITFILTIPDTDDLFTKFIEVSLNFTHGFFPELNIQITSPDGTVSEFTEEHVTGALSYISGTLLTKNDLGYTDQTHRFGSAKHLGEDPAGEWILKISDTDPGDTGTLHSWSIKVYGHMRGDTVPSFSSETIDDKKYLKGISVTETLPAATRGNGTLTYSLTPDLPDGLNFDAATREISGTPASASSGTYTYTVTDEDGDMAELNFMIRVVNPPPDPEAGGGGGCTISDQNDIFSDLLGAVASLILIPVSAVIRRKIRSQIKT